MEESYTRRVTVVRILVASLLVSSFVGAGVEAGSTIFTDSFDDPDSGWRVTETEAFSYGYDSGSFSIRLELPNMDLLTEAPLTSQLRMDTGFVVGTTARRVPGESGAIYGVVVGSSAQGLCYFKVATTGVFAIHIIESGQLMEGSVDWTASDAIRKDSASNVIRAFIVDRVATLEVNGVALAAVELGWTKPVGAAVYAATYEGAPIEVRFTEFSVSGAAAAEVPSFAIAAGSANLPFFDDFADDAGGWLVQSSETGGLAYRGGEYAIRCTQPSVYYYSYASLEPCPSGFEIAATAYKYSGEDDATYGIIWGTDNSNHYSFLVTADGWYAVCLQLNGEWQANPIDWMQSSHIRQGGEANTLELSVRDNRVAVGVNGIQLTSFSPILEGPFQVGVHGESYETAPVEIRFTEFSIEALE